MKKAKSNPKTQT